jgi:hypothetical protein
MPADAGTLGGNVHGQRVPHTAGGSVSLACLHAESQRLRQIDTAENAHAREIEELAAAAAPAAAITALRTRILARFTELEEERAAIDTQLADLAKTSRKDASPALLDRLPMLGDILAGPPRRLQAALYDALGIQQGHAPGRHLGNHHRQHPAHRRRYHRWQRRPRPRLYGQRARFGFVTTPRDVPYPP